MQVTLHDKRIVMQVTLHYEAIVMQVTLHDKRIVIELPNLSSVPKKSMECQNFLFKWEFIKCLTKES
nr:hypothetical protein [Tanacetum cinerariifolium]